MATVEETKQRVQRMLTSEGGGVRLTKDGRFAIEHGSTVGFVEVQEWAADQDGNPRSVVHMWAPIARDVPASPELYKWAATEGQDKIFGAVAIGDSDDGRTCTVAYSETLLGDYLDTAELMTSLLAVLFIADQLDDEVVAKFGGSRFAELVVLRDQVRDEALAAAKAYAHAEVEPRQHPVGPRRTCGVRRLDLHAVRTPKRFWNREAPHGRHPSFRLMPRPS